jgi:carbon starvation protein
MIFSAFAGIVLSNPTIQLPAFNGFIVKGNALFPILFVTVACGAVSGFHSLVSSGTASKQVDNERDILPIAFGGMLLESLLAVISLITVGALAVGGQMPAGSPPVIFATAVAGFLSVSGLPDDIIYTVVTLSISAFALTSLDSVARVGRLAWQEFFTNTEDDRSPLSAFLSNRYAATGATLLMGYLLALRGYQDIWPLFGSANQLLAALALTACAVFLKKTKRKSFMLYVPMVLMLLVTLSALGLTIIGLLGQIVAGTGASFAVGMQLVFAALLMGLGIMVALSGFTQLRSSSMMM